MHQRTPAGALIEMTGAFVQQQIERFQDASARGRVAENVARLRADASLRVLLQIPAVARVAREAFAGVESVRLVRSAGFALRDEPSVGRNRRRHVGRTLPRGRVRLHAWNPSRPAWQSPLTVVHDLAFFDAGTTMDVLRVTDAALLLWPPNVPPMGTAWRSL